MKTRACLVVVFAIVGLGCSMQAKPNPSLSPVPDGQLQTPTWPHATFGSQDLCRLSQVSDEIVIGRVVNVGKPELRELSLWPGEKFWWSSLTIEVLDSRRGEHPKSVVALVNADVSDSKVESLPAFSEEGDWFFLKRLPTGEYWLGVDSIGIRSKGTVTFVNGAFEKEEILISTFSETEKKAGCSKRDVSRLDRAIK